MKPIPAIVENDLARHAAAVDQALRNLREAQQHEEAAESRWNTARHVTARMRVELGHALAAARKSFPKSGRNAKGWTDFLRVRGIDPDVADDTMKYAGHIDERFSGAVPEKPPSMREAGIDRRPLAAERGDDDEPEPVLGQERDTPPFRQLTEEDLEQAIARLDPEVRDRLLRRARVNVSGGSGDSERATWRTSKLWAERVGSWDLDPFSNPRSVILSVARCMLEDGGDGFGGGEPGVQPGRYLTGSGHGQQPIGGVAGTSTRVWLQPPYTNGFVERVVAHYGHTRFCALLRLDPSTEWFAALWERTKLLAIPIGTREMFEPPPGVKASSNPQPHAFYYSDPRDITEEIAQTCILLNRYEALRLVR